jgi:hypothetical protein
MKKALFLLFLSISLFAQKPISLPRSSPEAEGVSSEAIANFVEAASNSKHEFHSFMVVRHGKVVAEGWWNPYRADLKHTMYHQSQLGRVADQRPAEYVGGAVARAAGHGDDR